MDADYQSKIGFFCMSIIRYPFEQITYQNKNATLIRVKKDYPIGMKENKYKTVS